MVPPLGKSGAPQQVTENLLPTPQVAPTAQSMPLASSGGSGASTSSGGGGLGSGPNSGPLSTRASLDSAAFAGDANTPTSGGGRPGSRMGGGRPGSVLDGTVGSRSGSERTIKATASSSMTGSSRAWGQAVEKQKIEVETSDLLKRGSQVRRTAPATGTAAAASGGAKVKSKKASSSQAAEFQANAARMAAMEIPSSDVHRIAECFLHYDIIGVSSCCGPPSPLSPFPARKTIALCFLTVTRTHSFVSSAPQPGRDPTIVIQRQMKMIKALLGNKGPLGTTEIMVLMKACAEDEVKM